MVTLITLMLDNIRQFTLEPESFELLTGANVNSTMFPTVRVQQLFFSKITDLKMTPFDEFYYLINSILLGEEPTIEDFILLVGTFVAFVAFVLWCCFPIAPKEMGTPSFYEDRYTQFRKTDGTDSD